MIPSMPPSEEKQRRPCHLALSTSMSLVSRLSRQEDGAWRDFLSLYSPLVVCWCKRRGIPRNDIGDLAQDVFREVSQSLVRFDRSESSSFRGWLCRIVHRQIANHFQRQRQPSAEGGSAAFGRLQQVMAPVEPEDDETQVLKETSYLYQRAVQLIKSEFTDKNWKIFWRLVVDDQTAPQVAAEFDMTPAAVRKIKSRVFRRLREVVGDLPEI